jgi:hypothetical protein
MKCGRLMCIPAIALLVVLAMAEPSQARIVYTPTHVVIHINNFHDLDLNHDGVADFTIKNAGNYGRYRLYASAAAGNGVVGSIGSNGAQAAALIRGEQIGPGQMFMAPDVTMRECIRHAICWGDWDNVTNRYLGLKFIIRGKLHYGWTRLNVQENLFFTATLTGYAYENIAGKSIKAGQTKGAADEWDEEGFDTGASVMSPITDTPQPAALGMLALSAQSVPLWRRRESVAWISKKHQGWL